MIAAMLHSIFSMLSNAANFASSSLREGREGLRERGTERERGARKGRIIDEGRIE